MEHRSMGASLALVICGVVLNVLCYRNAVGRTFPMDIIAPTMSIYGSDINTIFNVVDYGAHGDGTTDDSQAFMKAWNDACEASEGIPTYMVPAGKRFFLRPLAFQGPCKSSRLQIQLLGDLIAPSNKKDWKGCNANSWISFSDVNGLNIVGSGQLNGLGSFWWRSSQSLLEGSSSCKQPTAMHFHKCQVLRVNGLKSLNSPRNHISINECENVDISHVQLIAPEDSPNTDGIDISESSNINIHDSIIGTGDDCVAINGRSSYINIARLACGPGHGISVGSLGKEGARDVVANVNVQNCSFTGTDNGARIKTWEGGSGYATNITFEDITVHEAKNPIIIDQRYRDGQDHCLSKSKTAVQVSNVIYRRFRGTSASEIAINLDCSEIVPCQNLLFDNINLVPASSREEVKAYCKNAEGRMLTPTEPSLDCLKRC